MRLAKLLSSNHTVTSIIRDPSQEQDIKDVSATPLVLSLEDSPTADFSNAFEGYDVVYFSAGAGGQGGEERTKKVDYEGALKIFDAVEGVSGEKPLLILVSAVDVRDPDKIPAHYVRQTPDFPPEGFLTRTNYRQKKISRYQTGGGRQSQSTCTGNTRPTRTS